MIAIERFLRDFMLPGLNLLQAVGGPRVSPAANQMLLTIAQQESVLSNRAQIGSSARSPGPARGWWQFERGGGVAGVLTHQSSKTLAGRVCDHLEVDVNSYAVWRALEGNDQLAAAFARLLLWTDPKALPTSAAEGWDCYLRTWRPGKPHPETWGGYWEKAQQALAV